MTVTEQIRQRIEEAPPRSFFAVREVEGPRRAVETAFSRLAADGEVSRVRRGLYWKAPKTRFGMVAPRPGEIALAAAPAGSGPAGVTAARALGLTTQLPGVELIAVPGRVPAPIEGVRFMQRPLGRRLHGLQPAEVAVLEVLREWPRVTEVHWEQLERRLRDLITDGIIRPAVLDRAVQEERAPALRERWAALRRVLAA